MTKHLATCPARADAFAAAEAGKGSAQALYHLTVSTPSSSLFWLQLEMNGSATLEALDDYLRAIWLECCGHLSAFKIGGRSYTQIFNDGMGEPSDRSMKVRADKVLSPGMAIPYEYDFGSTTELLITVQTYDQTPDCADGAQRNAGDPVLRVRPTGRLHLYGVLMGQRRRALFLC
jgi:hypothetical protein